MTQYPFYPKLETKNKHLQYYTKETHVGQEVQQFSFKHFKTNYLI